MRLAVGIMVVAAAIGFAWVFSLPDKDECVASGRVVDPTERHCQDARGYQQLHEHALFHTRDVAVGAGILFAVGYGVHRYVRRRRTAPRPTA